MASKKVNYRQPGSGYEQSPPTFIKHPPPSMKPKPVLGKQNYSSEQQQKG